MPTASFRNSLARDPTLADRTWEALTLGAIPVMRIDEWHAIDRQKFDGLPIVWVFNWSIVTPAFLEEQWRRMASVEYDVRRLHSPYWLGRLTEGVNSSALGYNA